MASLSLVNSTSLTGTTVSSAVAVPENITRPGYITILLSAPKAQQNIYDVWVYIDSSRDGGNTWWVQHSSVEYRTMADANTAIQFNVKARVNNLVGRQFRVRIILGQASAAANVTFTEA